MALHTGCGRPDALVLLCSLRSSDMASLTRRLAAAACSCLARTTSARAALAAWASVNDCAAPRV